MRINTRPTYALSRSVKLSGKISPQATNRLSTGYQQARNAPVDSDRPWWAQDYRAGAVGAAIIASSGEPLFCSAFKYVASS